MIGRKSILGIFFLVLAYFFNVNTRVKIKGKLVNTKSGVVRGIVSQSRDGRDFYEWLGVPYAQPPVGELRFESPRPVERWEGVKEANEYGAVCAHMETLLQRHAGIEDCLFLNIHVPKDRKEGKLFPVMFWIYGGYFNAGSSNVYRPDYFMDEDVVLVTINYRLGAFGFLNTGDGSVRGNMGLKDQSMALKWINENVEYFGGDPDRITIFGESAGGSSVHYHILSPMSRGLFRKAIAESGTALNVWAIFDDPVLQAKQYGEKMKCPTESMPAMVECLKKLDASDIISAHDETTKLLGRPKSAMLVPTVEAVVDAETFLPDHPQKLMKAGKFTKVPLLLGGNAHEGLLSSQAFYKNETLRQDLREHWDWVDEYFMFLTDEEKKHSKEIKEFYFGTDDNFESLEKFPAFTDLMTDRLFFTGINKTAVLHSIHAPTYFYYYNKPSSLSLLNLLLMLKGTFPPIIDLVVGSASKWFQTNVLGLEPELFGACHGDELFQLFPITFAEPITKDHPDYTFSKDMVRWFAKFATDDEAPSFRGQTFPQVKPGDVRVVEVTDGPPEVKELPNKERLQFWESVFPL